MSFWRRERQQPAAKAAAPSARLPDLDLRGLSLRARALADGFHGGLHRAHKKGSGIEFIGHRLYTPGDDLRHLDRHAWMRHGTLLIREFETETDRALHLLVDATESMRYQRSGPETKLERAALLGLALAHLSSRAGDPVGLTLLEEDRSTHLPARTGREQVERILAALELTLTRERAPRAPGAATLRQLSEAALGQRRGSTVVLISDFFDFAETEGTTAGLASEAREALAALAAARRTIIALALRDPAELDPPFRGATRLVEPESNQIVETDLTTSRAHYLAALAALDQALGSELGALGGRFAASSTSAAPRANLELLLSP